jgi:hypothetical protein
MSDDINANSNRIFDRVLLDESVADSPRISVSIFRGVLITSSRDVSDPRTDPGVRVRGPRVGSLTSRMLSGACRSRGEGRRARSVRDRYADCPQRQRAAGEILKACGSDRRLWTTAIEANRRACLRVMAALGPSPPSPPPLSCVTTLCGGETWSSSCGDQRPKYRLCVERCSRGELPTADARSETSPQLG